MANPTTNYAFAMPTNTDLVKDLPADFEIFGQAVDTQMKTNADAAIAKTIVDAKGDLIAATAADTVSRLAVGANDTVLTADSSTATGLKWAAPASGGMTLISTTTLTGASVTLSSIPATYNNLQLVIRNFLPATDNRSIRIRINADATASRHYSLTTNSSNNDQVAGTFGDDNIQIGSSNDNSVGSGLIVVNLIDYANTTSWKMIDFQSIVTDPNNTAAWQLRNGFGYYNQTGAISSLELYSLSSNFTSGTALLYGVK